MCSVEIHPHIYTRSALSPVHLALLSGPKNGAALPWLTRNARTFIVLFCVLYGYTIHLVMNDDNDDENAVDMNSVPKRPNHTRKTEERDLCQQ